MGVIRDNTRKSTLPSEDASLTDDLNQLIQELNVNHTPPENDNNIQPRNESSLSDELVAEREARREKKRQSKKSSPKIPKPEATFKGLGCRGKSDRKKRRFENGNLLAQTIAMTGMDLDDIYDDIDIYDFVPRTMSAFAQLLMEKENMQAWNDFLAKTEDEQDEFLRQSCSDETVESWDAFDDVANQGKTPHHHHQHPAFSPELAFKRIDKDLRQLLQEKRRLPMNMLERMEEEMSDFFESDPMSVYQSCLPSGYERMLLHATAQYLNLACKSFNHKGSRWSKVRNKNHYFSRPAMKLVKFLEDNRVKREKEVTNQRLAGKSLIS